MKRLYSLVLSVGMSFVLLTPAVAEAAVQGKTQHRASGKRHKAKSSKTARASGVRRHSAAGKGRVAGGHRRTTAAKPKTRTVKTANQNRTI